LPFGFPSATGIDGSMRGGFSIMVHHSVLLTPPLLANTTKNTAAFFAATPNHA
jgi:hypothetical protein